MPAELERLPVSVDPVVGEALDGYLERLASANGMDHPLLIHRVRTGDAATAFLTTSPDPRLLANLHTLADLPPDRSRDWALVGMPGIDADDLDPTNKQTWRTVAARGWPPERGTALCPACLAADGVWRLAWRHPWVTACTRHQVWLAGTCPRCGRRFRSHRTPLRPIDAPAGTCGNPIGTRGRNCPQPLADLNAAPARGEVLLCQARIDAAIAGEQVAMLGQPADPSTYLSELKALTVLLLHLATQPGGDELAMWADAARADRCRSNGGRGARWGLAPPADLRLRGEALATADAILNRPDLETAAQALHPWTELTPPCNDGQLGWLADHTTMTPILTRLVMSATAAGRRLATLLDHESAPQVPVGMIPQALPADFYASRAGGMLEVTDPTGRLFISLCLARRHTAARSWVEAALALGLPAEMGVRTARACSANLLARPDRFVAVLDGLAEELLDASVEYRSREAAVRLLAAKAGWYRRWACRHHPGSRATSRGYAVTWLWTRYAGGHIDTSPGWPRSPNSTDRARFRRYGKRLGADATAALLEVAATTTARMRRTA